MVRQPEFELWLAHRARGGVSYIFIAPDGSWCIKPAEALHPALVFFTNPADRDWLARALPGVELYQLGACSGSGEPFLICELTGARGSSGSAGP